MMDNLFGLEYIEEPKIPFPQANTVETCISLIKFLQEGIKTTENIAKYCNFTDRQSGYYTSACKYLGLVQDFKRGGYQLTDLGKEVSSLPDKKLKIKFIELILEHKIFNEIFQLYNVKGITTEEAIKIMEKNDLYNMDSYDTYKRRSSTILAWCERIKKTAEKEGFNFRIYCTPKTEGDETEIKEATTIQKKNAMEIAKLYNKSDNNLLVIIIEAIIANGGKANYTKFIYPYIKNFYPNIYEKYKSIPGVVNELVQRHTKGLSGFCGDEIFIHIGPGTYSIKDNF